MCQEAREKCKEEAITQEILVPCRCLEEGDGLVSHVSTFQPRPGVFKGNSKEFFIFNNFNKLLNNI